MEKQNGGVPSVGRRKCTDRPRCEAHRAYQTGLYHSQTSLLCKDVVVQGNPRVYKALRDQFAAVLEELRRIEAGEGVNDELIDTINLIASIMDGMKEDDAYGN